jgi:hypothetical protein
MNERVASLLFKIRADTTSLREGMNQAKGAVNSLQGTIKSIGGGLMKLSGITLSVGAVFGIFKQILRSTELTSDSFDFAIATAKGSLQGLFSTMARGDWGNLISNIVNAAEATRDFKKAVDELTHWEASLSITQARLSARVAEARLSVAGTSDPQQKAKYLKEAIDFQEQLNDVTERIALRAVTIKENSYITLMGLDENYGKVFAKHLREIAENWEEFGDTPTELFKSWQLQYDDLAYLMSVRKLTPFEQQDLDNLRIALQVMKDYYELASKLAPEDWSGYAKSIAAYYSAIAEGQMALRRTTQGLTTAETKTNKIPAGTKVGKLEPISGWWDVYAKDFAKAEKGIEETSKHLVTVTKNTGQIIIDLSSEIQSGISNMIQSFASGIEGMISGDLGFDDFFKGILQSFGRFMQQMGAAIIAYGIGMDAFKKAFKNPGAAIAAGAALIIIGSIISGLAQRGPSGMGGGGGESSAMRTHYGTSTINIKTESITKGSDIYQVSKRYQDFRYATT